MAAELPKLKFDWQGVWEKIKVPFILVFAGLLLASFGYFLFLSASLKEPEIEIIPVQEAKSDAAIFVDLEGAIENPGLYQLPAESRLNDLLVKAGGLSAEADRDWAEKNFNLAQKLIDGAKIYVPQKGEAANPTAGKVAGSSASLTGLININTASLNQLESLWGIGEARAGEISANRPYQLIEELKTKKIIPSNVFEKIKDQITVY